MLLEQMMGKSEFTISSLKGTVQQVAYMLISTLMTAPNGNSEFCFPKTLKEH